MSMSKRIRKLKDQELISTFARKAGADNYNPHNNEDGGIPLSELRHEMRVRVCPYAVKDDAEGVEKLEPYSLVAEFESAAVYRNYDPHGYGEKLEFSYTELEEEILRRIKISN